MTHLSAVGVPNLLPVIVEVQTPETYVKSDGCNCGEPQEVFEDAGCHFVVSLVEWVVSWEGDMQVCQLWALSQKPEELPKASAEGQTHHIDAKTKRLDMGAGVGNAAFSTKKRRKLDEWMARHDRLRVKTPVWMRKVSADRSFYHAQGCTLGFETNQCLETARRPGSSRK